MVQPFKVGISRRGVAIDYAPGLALVVLPDGQVEGYAHVLVVACVVEVEVYCGKGVGHIQFKQQVSVLLLSLEVVLSVRLLRGYLQSEELAS